VGVNKYRLDDEPAIDVLKVDNSSVRAQQIEKLARLRAERDPAAVAASLEALAASARSGEGNLLALAVDAARAKATVGEISTALEEAWKRHKAVIKVNSGVYRDGFAQDTAPIERLSTLVSEFTHDEGRAPRILVAKMGQDGHDRGQKVIATAFADIGFDVVIGPLFATPEEVATHAIAERVH